MATIESSSPPEKVGVVPGAGGLVGVAELNGHATNSPAAPKITQEMIDVRIERLLRQVQANRPSEDVSLIRKAWEFCVQHHAGQERASGEPYIIHPLEVAEVLAEMKMDATAIAAGLLHDSVEDTPATNEEIGE